MARWGGRTYFGPVKIAITTKSGLPVGDAVPDAGFLPALPPKDEPKK
jgi:hypothetical protein